MPREQSSLCRTGKRPPMTTKASASRSANADLPDAVGPIKANTGSVTISVRAETVCPDLPYPAAPRWAGHGCTARIALSLPYRATAHSSQAASNGDWRVLSRDRPWSKAAHRVSWQYGHWCQTQEDQTARRAPTLQGPVSRCSPTGQGPPPERRRTGSRHLADGTDDRSRHAVH